MKDAIRIGIVGCGEIVEQFHLPILRKLDAYRIAWLCDRQTERANRVARRFGVAQAYTALEECPDVDCVLVATPVGSRRSIMETVFRRGWHAFCEKPFAVNMQDHRWMLESAAQHKLVLAGGYMRRHYWSTQTAASLLGLLHSRGSLKITASDCQRLKRSFHGGNWYLTDPKAGSGGFLMETGSHLVDQMLTVLDAREVCIEKVTQTRIGHIDYETLASGTITAANQCKITFRLALSRLHDWWSGLAISFADNRFEIALAPGSPIVIVAGADVQRTVLPPPNQSTFELLGAYTAQFQQFSVRVRTRDVAANSFSTGLLTTQFIAECYQRCQATLTSSK